MSTRHLANNFIFVNNRRGKVCSYHISTFAVYFIGIMGKFIDLTGQKFGRLTVIERYKSSKGGHTRWKCMCDCGRETISCADGLRNGQTTSCGCLNREKIIKARQTHGMWKSRIYRIWKGMISRCCCETDGNYKNYGGRGIAVCEEWLHNFQAFYDWSTQNGYADNLTIDRIDNDKGYYPYNCRWITFKKQQNNRRNNHNITFNGETHTLSEWSEITGVSYQHFYAMATNPNVNIKDVLEKHMGVKK